MRSRKSLSLVSALFLGCIVSLFGHVNAADTTPPSFSLAWSEYPSWSVFGVADTEGLIDGRKGELGPLEKKWSVDVELKEAEYDPCLQLYGAAQCDAVCITNMDVLNPSLIRKSVMVFPTSTSYGADALIVTKDIASPADLRGKPIYMLEKSVSQYCFTRYLESVGEKEADFKITNMDPGAAAVAMQQKQDGYNAIVVWNPFVLETLNKRPDVKVLSDSRVIPGEIIDSIVIAQESLDKPGGDRFVLALMDAYYQVCVLANDPATRDQTLVEIGEKFSNLNLESMKKVVQQTRFFENPDQALQLMTDQTAFPGGKVQTNDHLKGMMVHVVDFCVKHDIVPKTPNVGYGTKTEAPDADLRFDPSYLQAFIAQNKK